MRKRWLPAAEMRSSFKRRLRATSTGEAGALALQRACDARKDGGGGDGTLRCRRKRQ